MVINIRMGINKVLARLHLARQKFGGKFGDFKVILPLNEFINLMNL